MPTFTIRDVSEQAAQSIRERAAAAGKSTEAYIREWIEMQAQQPVVKEQYTLKAYGEETGARIHITRLAPDGAIKRGANNCTQEQYDAYKRAADLVTRNQPGDRERAIGVLQSVFDEVFELV